MILFVLPYHMRTICLYINIQYIGGRHTQQNINFQFDFILRVRARTTYTTIYSRRQQSHIWKTYTWNWKRIFGVDELTKWKRSNWFLKCNGRGNLFMCLVRHFTSFEWSGYIIPCGLLLALHELCCYSTRMNTFLCHFVALAYSGLLLLSGDMILFSVMLIHALTYIWWRNVILYVAILFNYL